MSEPMMRIVQNINELIPPPMIKEDRISCDLFGNGVFQDMVISKITKTSFTAVKGCVTVRVKFSKTPSRHAFWRSLKTRFINYQYMKGDNE